MEFGGIVSPKIEEQKICLGWATVTLLRYYDD